jgi:hypothetical protein
MRYYQIKQDFEYSRAPEIHGLGETFDAKCFRRDRSFELPMRTVVRAEPREHVDFVDYFYHTAPFFSEKAIDIVRMFEEDFIYKQIVLVNPKTTDSRIYVLPFFERLGAGALLETRRMEGHGEIPARIRLSYPLPIFYLFDRGGGCNVVTRLDLAESLLRNGARGMKLLPVIVEEDW